MKQFLLTFLFAMFISVGFSQNLLNCLENPDDIHHPSYRNTSSLTKQLTIYPNPATNFIMLKNSTDVNEVRIFNLIGRQVTNFTSVEKGQSFPVANLPNGMYLVQLIDVNNDIISTHRMNKR